MPAFVPAGAIVRKQKQIVAAFRSAGVTARERAATIGDLDVREGLALRTLRRHDILRDAGGGCFYLDEPAWEAHRAKRRRIALVIVGLVVLAAAVALVWSTRA
jgi:hypothetical protein